MRVDLSRFPLQAVTMTFPNHGSDNVVAFPGAHRRHQQAAIEPRDPSSPRSKRRNTVSGAELNARILVLFGICTSSAAIILTTTHILQGS
jgi:hypothetical protein